MDELCIEPLDKRRHVRAAFSCGQIDLDVFIRQLATQYERRKLGKTMVAVRGTGSNVIGYYTLAASSVAFSNMPVEATKGLARHAVPVILLARLAVDRSAQRQRIGEALLRDALHRALALSDALGVFAVEVQAVDENARRFYSKYGFQSLVDNVQHMYLPIKTIEQSIAAPKRAR